MGLLTGLPFKFYSKNMSLPQKAYTCHTIRLLISTDPLKLLGGPEKKTCPSSNVARVGDGFGGLVLLVDWLFLVVFFSFFLFGLVGWLVLYGMPTPIQGRR